MDAAQVIFSQVARTSPNLYQEISTLIQPHSIDSVMKHFQSHLEASVPDLNVFNEHSENIPSFLLAFVKAIRKRIPSPGDPFGIQLTCRITKADTQETLDSKHLQSHLDDAVSQYNVEYALKHEINIFSSQTQVYELATKHTYSSVWVKDMSIEELFKRIPDLGYLSRGFPLNKGLNKDHRYRHLSTFKYIFVEDRVLYKTVRDLNSLIRCLDPKRIVAITDLRYLFQKCGIVSHYFNFIKVIDKQLLAGKRGTVFERDVLTIVKFQCRSGQPLPLTRDGLAKNQERSPIEILSFEAPKKNYTRMCTGPETIFPVKTSADKIFFGQQFSEGTGYQFAVLSNK